METIIKLSSNILNNETIRNIVLSINQDLNKSFDYYKYKTIYNNVLENGLKLVFYENLNQKHFLKIHLILKKYISNYNCSYIENDFYKGCINGLLYNKPCFVGFERKQEKCLIH